MGEQTEQWALLIGASEHKVYLHPEYATRHGLIAGATGTGKTVSMQVLAEQFSRIGVPVFMADVKGDLSGISQSGSTGERIMERVSKIGIEGFEPEACPTMFWDLFGEQGHPLRTTVSEVGPLLLARLLELNETQLGVLTVLFKVADDEGLLLLDLKDLRSMLNFVGQNAKTLSVEYGRVSPASVAAIQRRLLMLEQQGVDQFFGEPALDLRDFLRTGEKGYGYMHVLTANRLMEFPRLYSTFLLWLMAELFEELPEVGDLDKPRMVFFFDEAHLLFDNAPRALLEKIEQVVRLIRSKGVGVFFVTQNPGDIPEEVLGQLANRVQHGLRAFTAKDRKQVKAIAQNFRDNPALDTATVITELGVGEALVSTLEGKGTPCMVQQTLMSPPRSRIGPATDAEREQVIKLSPLTGKYDDAVDRQSAWEMLKKRAEQAAKLKAEEDAKEEPEKRSSGRQGIIEAMAKSFGRSIASGLARRVVRGILGSLGR